MSLFFIVGLSFYFAVSLILCSLLCYEVNKVNKKCIKAKFVKTLVLMFLFWPVLIAIASKEILLND